MAPQIWSASGKALEKRHAKVSHGESDGNGILETIEIT